MLESWDVFPVRVVIYLVLRASPQFPTSSLVQVQVGPHLEQKMSLNDTGCSLQCYIRQILIRGKCHALAARSPRGRIQRHFQETTRLHDYDATGNIKTTVISYMLYCAQ
jgi:hypothetical protein